MAINIIDYLTTLYDKHCHMWEIEGEEDCVNYRGAKTYITLFIVHRLEKLYNKGLNGLTANDIIVIKHLLNLLDYVASATHEQEEHITDLYVSLGCTVASMNYNNSSESRTWGYKIAGDNTPPTAVSANPFDIVSPLNSISDDLSDVLDGWHIAVSDSFLEILRGTYSSDATLWVFNLLETYAGHRTIVSKTFKEMLFDV